VFTGLVEETGTVKEVKKSGQTLFLSIQAKLIMEDIKLGDSISVNGVCLTVTAFDDITFTVDVMPATFYDTALCLLREGMKVNLERAMAANGRFGGHFVSGHVDGTGIILSKQKKENSTVMEIEIPDSFKHLMMEKGSITVDGTSLTIFKASKHFFSISLIPHTATVSILGDKKTGDIVNLEFDLLAKYFHSFMAGGMNVSSKKQGNVTTDFLKENGFY
jgi:riboflavin synthase